MAEELQSLLEKINSDGIQKAEAEKAKIIAAAEAEAAAIREEAAKDAAAIAMPEREFTIHRNITPASTDMGDLSTIMPVVHPYCPGARGKGHGNDYEIHDPYLACVQNSKWQVTMLTLLLENEAERAKKQDDSGKVAEGRAWGHVHTCGLCPKSKEESPELC